MPLVGGKMEPSDRRYSQTLGQILFLDAVRRYVPEVLKELRREVLPVYEQVVTRSRPSAASLRHVSAGHRPSLLPLKERLDHWAGRCHLGDEWALEVALRTLEYWRGGAVPVGDGTADLLSVERRAVKKEGRLRWCTPEGHAHAMPLAPWRTQLVVERGGSERVMDIDLVARTRAEEEDRAKALGIPRARIREALDRVEQDLEGLGLIPTPEKRNHQGLSFHFELLAMYQCGGFSRGELASKTEVDQGKERQAPGYSNMGREGVRRAIKEAAELIDLKQLRKAT